MSLLNNKTIDLFIFFLIFSACTNSDKEVFIEEKKNIVEIEVEGWSKSELIIFPVFLKFTNSASKNVILFLDKANKRDDRDYTAKNLFYLNERDTFMIECSTKNSYIILKPKSNLHSIVFCRKVKNCTGYDDFEEKRSIYSDKVFRNGQIIYCSSVDIEELSEADKLKFNSDTLYLLKGNLKALTRNAEFCERLLYDSSFFIPISEDTFSFSTCSRFKRK